MINYDSVAQVRNITRRMIDRKNRMQDIASSIIDVMNNNEDKLLEVKLIVGARSYGVGVSEGQEVVAVLEKMIDRLAESNKQDDALLRDIYTEYNRGDDE